MSEQKLINFRKLPFAVLRGLLFLLILIVMVLYLDGALKLKHRDGISAQYYSFPRKTFDVVFLGSSVLKFGVSPMELYGEHGIVSYNLSTGNQSPGMSYYLAKEAIEKDHPKLIVLECGRSFFEEKPKQAPYIHYVTDSMPYYSRNRVGLIMDLAEQEDQMRLLFPLLEYHSRWQEFKEEEAGIHLDKKLYGARVRGHTEECVPFAEPEIIPNYISKSSLDYIMRTIELCRENNTDLLLLSMPILGENSFFDQRGYNYRASVASQLRGIAQQEGVLYADWFGRQEELGLDPETDGCDGEHLNRWGAKKFSSYLGDFLDKHYDLPDRRGTGEKYRAIEKDYERYPVTRMAVSLLSAQSLEDYSGLLAVDAVKEPVQDALILIALGGTAQDEKISEEDDVLLKKIGIKQDLSKWEGHGWIAVIDGGRLVYETAPSEEKSSSADESESGDIVDSYEGSTGKITYRVTSGSMSEAQDKVTDCISFVINGQHYELQENGLQFLVFDKSSGDLMDACCMKRNKHKMRCIHAR